MLCYPGQENADLGLFPGINVIRTKRKSQELATGHYLLKGYDKAVLVHCYPDQVHGDLGVFPLQER